MQPASWVPRETTRGIAAPPRRRSFQQGGKGRKKASRAEEIAGKLLIRQAGDVRLAGRPRLTRAAANRWTQVASCGRRVLYVWRGRFSSLHKLRGEPEGGATGNDRPRIHRAQPGGKWRRLSQDVLKDRPGRPPFQWGSCSPILERKTTINHCNVGFSLSSPTLGSKAHK
ncbi:hypothetical protein MTO96_013538 [Rhipicephalus appendiculatus]